MKNTEIGFSTSCIQPVPETAPTLILRVYGGQGEAPWGALVRLDTEEKIECADLGDAVLRAEEVYAGQDRNGRESEFRSLLPAENRLPGNWTAAWDTARYFRREPCEATFVIQMIYRQNMSWQGRVIWQERGRACLFRSALELMHMMYGVLEHVSEETAEERCAPD